MTRPALTALVLASLALPQVAVAQSRFSMEGTFDAAYPTSRFAGAGLATGVGFEATLRWRLRSPFSLYGGWAWHHFHAREPIGGERLNPETESWVLGLRHERPVTSWASAWMRAGATYGRVELRGDYDRLIDRTDHGIGWEAAGGLAVPIRRRVMLVSGLGYGALSRELEIDGVATSLDIRYIPLFLGATWRF